MDDASLRRWFARYMEVFAAAVESGGDDLADLLAFYAVPLLITTDDGPIVAATEGELGELLRPQVDGMRAAGYARTVVLSDDVERINATTAHYRCELSRRRADDSEIAHMHVSYLAVEEAGDLRIRMMAVRS